MPKTSGPVQTDREPSDLQATRDIDLAARRLEPVGLLERYARGRLTYFWMRQGLTVTGAVTLGILISPMLGVLAAAIAVIGETVDCLVLRQVLKRLDAGLDFDRTSIMSAISAGFQSLTIGACVLLAWTQTEPGVAVHFCVAFLASAALNAGIVWPFHPLTAQVRLAVYGATALIGFGTEFHWNAATSTAHLFNAMGHALMGYLVYVIIGHVIRSHERHKRYTEKIIASAQSLEQTHERLIASEQRARKLSLVARYANDSIILADSSGRITWVNHAFEAITGYSKKDVLGKTPDSFLNGPNTDAGAIQNIAQEIQAGRPIRTEILNYRKDGSEIWMETNLVPVTSKQGLGDLTIAIERDISELKKHEAEMAQAQHDAERGERAKSEFLATMSHEIRTPMNGIIGLSDLLVECDLDPEARSYAETIQSSAEGLLTIINDILDFSKLDAGKLTIDPVEFDIQACLQDAVQLFAGQADEKGIFIDVIQDQTMQSRVVGDDGRLRQILINLIGNALKFTDRGGVTIRTDMQIKDREVAAQISIADTGIGIASDQLTGIFDKFSQADGQITRKFGGTGLGLAISRLLARRMGGDISVTSQIGVGSTFDVRIKLGLPEGIPSPGDAPDIIPDDIADCTVLVAEDNKTNRFVIEKYLKDTGVDLLFAEDGKVAVELTLSAKPDVIFMDMSMPHMDGLEATRIIRTKDIDQPRIIALTANAFASDKAACLKAGMDDFLSKPVRKADLLAKLAAFAPSD